MPPRELKRAISSGASVHTAVVEREEEAEKVVYEGWMFKEGHVRKNFKKRWFQLSSHGNLSYSEDEGRKTIDSMSLGGCTIVPPKNIRKGHPHAFRLDIESGTGEKAKYILAGTDAEDSHQWQSMILKYADQLSDEAKKRQQIEEEELSTALG